MFRQSASCILLFALVLLISSLLLTTYNFVYLEPTPSLTTPASKESNHSETVLDKLWPVKLPSHANNWEDENSKSMRALLTCISSNTCKENQTSIVLLTSPHITGAIEGKVSGENIWGSSIIEALRQMGYTWIYTAPNDDTHLAQTYRLFPDLVKVIILQGHSATSCLASGKCIKTPTHPLGVPAWKMLSFAFWQGPDNPLGSAWTLSPENYPMIYPKTSKDNVYLGYSIEKACLNIPVTPIRDRPNQAYVLAKHTGYFGEDFTWPDIALDQAPFDVELVAGLVPYNNSQELSIPKGITNLGRLNKTEFYHNLGRSRVLIGIGKPKLSPSPYDALCMGVPFINPVSRWDKKDPENRMRWVTQHDSLKYQNPPYVYNVKTGDADSFWNAVGQAMNTPIERYIIPEMSMESLKYRLGNIIEDDWRGKAERLLEERKAFKHDQIGIH